jgi:hypothetical protein
MTQDEYDALCARLDKANHLSAAVREEYQELYDSLVAQALQYEFEHKRFPLHMVTDENVRMAVEYLHNDHMAMLRAESVDQYRAQAVRVLSACMALVSEDADKALLAFGYREVGA